jgi:primosomal protein N' (replication factor Y)
MLFADIILPLALPKRTYTFSVSTDLERYIHVGQRVEVPFGKSKLYSGIVERVHDEVPSYKVKEIISVLDELPVISSEQIRLWDWIASYYCATLGEVMLAALPGNMKLSSETRITFNTEYTDDLLELSADEYLVAEALQLQPEITIEDVRKILNRKTVLPIIQKLLHRGVLFLREELQEKYKPRKVVAIRWCEPYKSNPDTIKDAFDLAKTEPQVNILMAFVQLVRNQPFIKKKELLNAAGTSDAPLKSLVKLGVLDMYEREVSRVGDYREELMGIGSLSEHQSKALSEINQHFIAGKKVVLLQGVTGSGKTQVYIELIRETILQGGQALYLLPEIALTTQIVGRLQKVFGGDIGIYHSKINANERVEAWNSAATGKPVILAARSGLFLPFQNLQLIIVDEEHDASFKQYDPAPRYHARDAAIYMGSTGNANVLLGSATPAVESYHNAMTGKYGFVEMKQRFGGVEMPDIQVVDLKDQQKKKLMHGIFSNTLIEALKETIANGEQAILFQNRRGYAPILECETCGWGSTCQNCDVSLTYHKFQHTLRCHYCNFKADVPETCPACGSGRLVMLGSGTEKIEDDLKIFLPTARIARMDLDTAGTKNNMTALLNEFEDRELDILVGTQMVSKGLDFENVALVGVLSADQIVRFPDFRSGERAFQLITQVSGRAGRKKKRGKVLIQAYATTHPVVLDVLDNNYQRFIERELAEREAFRYPPFIRLIHLNIQHKDDKVTSAAAAYLTAILRDKLGPQRVLGPVIPPVGRIRNYYHQNIMLKLEKSGDLVPRTKQLIKYCTELLVGKQGWSQVRVAVDVDPA